MRIRGRCCICAETIEKNLTYCYHCKSLMERGQEEYSRASVRQALDESWDRRAFLCHYTDVELNESNSESPYYLTFDRKKPGNKRDDDLVVCAAFIGNMKANMSEEEFWVFICKLEKRYRNGTALVQNDFFTEYWERGEEWEDLED